MNRSSAPLLLLSFTLCSTVAGRAQATATTETSSSCSLKDYVYHCDSAAFQQSLTSAKTAIVEATNVDTYARSELRKLIEKYGKTVKEGDGPPDLIFLIVPVGVEGVNINPGEPTLGTLRVYSATPAGGRKSLLWAETFNGPQDLPWQTVVRALIAKFQKEFPPR